VGSVKSCPIRISIVSVGKEVIFMDWPLDVLLLDGFKVFAQSGVTDFDTKTFAALEGGGGGENININRVESL